VVTFALPCLYHFNIIQHFKVVIMLFCKDYLFTGSAIRQHLKVGTCYLIKIILSQEVPGVRVCGGSWGRSWLKQMLT
jgi:hypothetical protein